MNVHRRLVVPVLVALLVLSVAPVASAAGPVFYPDRAAQPVTSYADRAAFLAAVGESITDDYSAYGVVPGAAPLELTDAEMGAVLGETAYESLSSPDRNSVGDVYVYGGGTNYCAACAGNFRLRFAQTSVSVGHGVFGVGVNILLHTSRHSAIGDVLPGDTVLPGTVLVEFKDGEVMAVTIPADVGFFGPEIYFLGLTDNRGIKSLTFGIEPLSQRHFWVIDDLTIAGRPKRR